MVCTFFANFFLKEISFLPKLHLFDQEYIKNSNIVKYYYNLKWLFTVIYSCDGKAEFWAVIALVFSVTWSFKMLMKMKKILLIIIIAKNSCAA